MKEDKDKGRISYFEIETFAWISIIFWTSVSKGFKRRWIPETKKSALLFNWFIYNCTFPGKRIVTIVALAIGCQWTSNHIVHCAIGAGKTVTFTLTSTTFVIRNGLQGNILESYVLLFQFISVLLQFLDRLIWDL